MSRIFTKTTIAKAVMVACAIGSLLPALNADELDLPTAPLVTSTSVNPNMMLFVDSSFSMAFIVEDTPYDKDATYFDCNNSNNQLPGFVAQDDSDDNMVVRIRIGSDNKPYFNYDTKDNVKNNGSNLDYDFGNDSGDGITDRTQKCFQDEAVYAAVLYADDGNDNGLKEASPWDGAYYTGHYLNWYFYDSATNFTDTVARKRNDTYTRNEVAQQAAKTLIDSLSNMRVGLSVFDNASGEVGAKILSDFVDVDDQKESLKTKVDDIGFNTSTPLANAMQELGRYFTLGYSSSSKLTIHPDESNEDDVKVSDIFTETPNYSSAGAPSAVTQYWCQNNFLVAMTDGSPQKDQDNISSYLEDYDGDCSVSSVCNDHDQKKEGGYSYLSSGSDYVDDVLLAMYDIDLRPDLTNNGTAVKNNVTTYIVGFAEEFLANDPLIADMAEAGGGGELFSAADSGELDVAFQRVMDDISAKVAAGSGAAFNTSQFSDDSFVYAASFDSARWSGILQAFELSDTGDVSLTATWNAATQLKAMDYGDRNIFSYNSTTKKGIEFDEANISDAQKADLELGPKDSAGVSSLINYLKGDTDNEGSGTTDYRIRTNPLGDIVNSTLVYVEAPELNWPAYDSSADVKFGSATAGYTAFKSDNKDRSPMLYVGANDGMLHGFSADDGKEKFAYIPSIITSTEDGKGLHYLAKNDYAHQFYVDLTPTVSDVFIHNAWRSVLIGGLRGGGQGLFALDITNPTKFSSSTANAESLALWEFSSENDDDFGYSYSKPTVAMMANGKWAVIVGNGYNNTEDGGDGNAKLFIIYLEKIIANDGSWSLDYVKIDTGAGSSGTPNGLSTPRAVDLDGDSVVDRIYAGDLQGNMWAFDVSDTSDGNWEVAYGGNNSPEPLFNAKDSDSNGNTQAITAAPIVAENINLTSISNGNGNGNNSSEPDILVFFGTGKYLEESDKLSTQTMSYYGVLDNGSGDKSRADLTERKLITSGNARVISGVNIDWTDTEGWYFDLLERSTESDDGTGIGERIISNSLIRNGILLFPTVIPNIANTDICVSNSESWLMAVDLNTGKAPIYSVFDINGDNSMDDGDTTAIYDSNGDDEINEDDKVSYGGTKLSGSMVAGDIAILGDNVYSNDVDGVLIKEEVNIERTEKQGRLSWVELVNH